MGFYKMEVGNLNSEFSSPRGGEAVHYGCSISTMSYLTFAMIGIYTAINVNNNINNNNNNNKNTNENKRKKRSAPASPAIKNDVEIVHKLIQQPLSDREMANDIVNLFIEDILLEYGK